MSRKEFERILDAFVPSTVQEFSWKVHTTLRQYITLTECLLLVPTIRITYSKDVSESLVTYFQNATEPSVAVEARYLHPFTVAGQKLTLVITPVWIISVATYGNGINFRIIERWQL